MFAVLHVADFSLQAVLRIERDLAAQAVALLDETRRPPVVIACTAAARAAGVDAGLTSPQAMARCPAVVLRSRQPAADDEARAGLLAAAFSIAPQVEDTAPGVCTIQVTALPGERREPALHAALAQLRQLGLVATAGLAGTPLLALFAAREGDPAEVAGRASRDGAPGGSALRGLRSQSEGEYIQADRERWAAAESEAGRTAPGGPARRVGADDSGAIAAAEPACVVIPPHRTRAFLRDLPLMVAEPPPELADILAGWGVRTLGELTALTKADVTQRLGPEGLALWERAAGEVTRPLRLITPPQVFAAQLELEQEVETLEPVLFVLRRFIDRLALELRNAGFVAGEMTLELRLVDESMHIHEFRLPEPTAQEEILFRVLHTHLETLHTAAAVRGLGFACRPVRPLARQQGLFDSALRDPCGFAETLARVAAVVGPERIGTPVLENTHRSDAVLLQPPPAVVPPAALTEELPPVGPPLRRHRPPIAATVELQGVAPCFVWSANVRGAVRALAGPWRGSGDWWDASRVWRREEWDVELDCGGLYRLLHTPDGWFVEGEYD